MNKEKTDANSLVNILWFMSAILAFVFATTGLIERAFALILLCFVLGLSNINITRTSRNININVDKLKEE